MVLSSVSHGLTETENQVDSIIRMLSFFSISDVRIQIFFLLSLNSNKVNDMNGLDLMLKYGLNVPFPTI